MQLRNSDCFSQKIILMLMKTLQKQSKTVSLKNGGVAQLVRAQDS